MRVSPRELKAVHGGGLVTRYAVMGAAAFVMVDLPRGSAGTVVEDLCRLEHWGLVLHGELALEARRPRRFETGTAFYVAPGPAHRFRATDRTVVAGFVPVTGPIDDSPEALRERGVEVLRRAGTPTLPPRSVRIEGQRTRTAASGEIQTESAAMGEWLFTRSTFGPRSGFAESWCDLPHWGLVLAGDLVLHWENGDLELLGPGDAFHCPEGPPGHRIEVADAATIVDYTPISAVDDPGRRRAERAVVARTGRSRPVEGDGRPADAQPTEPGPVEALA